MSDDWTPGDLALCIKVGQWRCSTTLRPTPAPYPKTGRVYTVTCVGLAGGGLCLELAEVPTPLNPNGSKRPWRANRFIKVTPPKADEFDGEVIELMTSRPTDPVRVVQN